MYFPFSLFLTSLLSLGPYLPSQSFLSPLRCLSSPLPLPPFLHQGILTATKFPFLYQPPHAFPVFAFSISSPLHAPFLLFLHFSPKIPPKSVSFFPFFYSCPVIFIFPCFPLSILHSSYYSGHLFSFSMMSSSSSSSLLSNFNPNFPTFISYLNIPASFHKLLILLSF